MKLEHLWIESFKNLKDFTISFSSTPITTIVGRNGTGKSNVLEALTLIFRDLDLGNQPSFRYKIAWSIGDHQIAVDANPSLRSSRHKIEVDGRRGSLKALQGGEHQERLLPVFVFGYYSGPSNRMEEHFLPHQRRFYRELLAGNSRPLRPLFFARSVHAQFVLLAFFLSEDVRIKQFLRDYLRIVDFDSVTFVLKEPEWQSSDGDQRFWNARGTVQILLDRLFSASLPPIRRRVSVENGLGRPSQREHLWLFLESLGRVREVRDLYKSDQEFFKALESLLISDVVESVRVQVRTVDSEDSMSFRELSEGEQQLLMVIGLLRFTGEDESLLLLDEPDTHLNAAWSVEYRRMLVTYGALGQGSSLVLVTHDPLVIADQVREEVRVLKRDANGVRATLPEQDPRGQGVAGLLTSDIYGLESELDPSTRDELSLLRRLAVKETRSPEEDVELAKLSRRLRNLDMASTSRDPLFTEFARAMQRRSAHDEQTYVFTSEHLEERRRMTDEVLAEVLGGDE